MVAVFPANKEQLEKPNDFGLFFFPLHEEHLKDETVVWFDLHVSSKGFKNPDPYDREPWLPFEKHKNSTGRFVRLNPGHTIVVQTIEIVGTNDTITGVIVGSAGCSLKGLLITPGKIDPNFGPRPIALALTNGGNESAWIQEGDKIAVVAFSRLSSPHRSPKIRGHAESAEDKLPPWLQRLIASIKYSYRRYKYVGAATILFYVFVIFSQALAREWMLRLVEFFKSVWTLLFV